VAIRDTPEEIISRMVGVLRAERLRQGLSQNEVAKRSQLSHTMVMRVEKQERMPTVDTLLRICAALDIELWKVLKSVSTKS
jgi:transcriptional regulator with XRE-family HTH domain